MTKRKYTCQFHGTSNNYCCGNSNEITDPVIKAKLDAKEEKYEKKMTNKSISQQLIEAAQRWADAHALDVHYCGDPKRMAGLDPTQAKQAFVELAESVMGNNDAT